MVEFARRLRAAGGAVTPSWVVIRIVLLAIGIRLVSSGVAFWSNVTLPPYEPIPFTVMAEPHAFWDTFARYDSGWYRGIAQDGYRYVESGRSNLAFFPGYPLAMRAVAPIFGTKPRHFYFAGIAVSWAAFVVGMVLLYKLARIDLEEEAAERAVVYAAVFPFAFFQGKVYAEGLFLCLMVATFLAMRRERWLLAGIVGAIAVVTRVNGVMALPAFAWLAFCASRDARHRLTPWMAPGLALAGFGAWCAFNFHLSGSPIEWKHSIMRWEYVPGTTLFGPLPGMLISLVTNPYTWLTTDPLAPYDALNGLSATAFGLAIPFVWHRFGAAYGLFMLANLALPLSTGHLVGLGRYCSVLFPFFIWLAATVRSPLTHGFVLFASASLYALCLALFTNIHPLF